MLLLSDLQLFFSLNLYHITKKVINRMKSKIIAKFKGLRLSISNSNIANATKTRNTQQFFLKQS